MNLTLLDGPIGTQLTARGVSTELPLWSAAAIDDSPETISEIHRDYASAGAVVHTANTFRTKRRTVGDDWQRLVRRAVKLARQTVGRQRVAGSIAPLEDCYRPDLSPKQPRNEHRELARLLADTDCDLLLCETFPHVGEAIIAVEEAVETGLETWVSFTAGPDANLLSPQEIVRGAREAVGAGAAAVLVNCVPATDMLRFVGPLGQADLGVPIGAYANAGSADDKIGWTAAAQPGAVAYAEFARQWFAAGATIIGGCCGTNPLHIAEIKKRLEET